MARMMVGQMGFSKKLGQVAWSSSGGNSFLGAQMAQPADCSGETQDAIDAEVKVRFPAILSLHSPDSFLCAAV